MFCFWFVFRRHAGEEAEIAFCDNNYLSLSSLRMSGEARVSCCHHSVVGWVGSVFYSFGGCGQCFILLVGLVILLVGVFLVFILLVGGVSVLLFFQFDRINSSNFSWLPLFQKVSVFIDLLL